MTIEERKLQEIDDLLKEENFWLDRSYEQYLYYQIAMSRANMSCLIQQMNNCMKEMEILIKRS